jgi:hypothetical protein
MMNEIKALEQRWFIKGSAKINLVFSQVVGFSTSSRAIAEPPTA